MNIRGLGTIAIKLLTGDGGKFFTLILGVSFAVFLMLQMTSIFFGVIAKSGSSIYNTDADMWVMDRSVDNSKENIPLPDYVLDYARSLPGVLYAAPIYFGAGTVKLPNGKYQAVDIVGLDDVSLMGRPIMIQGNINDIYSSYAFIAIKDPDLKKLGNVHIGSTFEINDHKGVIVGFAKTAMSGLFGNPTLYTTYTRATEDLPNTRFTISYVLIKLKSPKYIPQIKKEIAKLGYRALTSKEFTKVNANFYMFKTGFGTNVLIMTLVSFIVGLSIAGQTFYTFVLENLEKFGALKAIGATRKELVFIIILQAVLVGLIGYGVGVLLASSFIAFGHLKLPNYAAMISYGNMLGAFVMVIFIVAFASFLGIRKVLKIEAFDVFRG
jgi:ABC-type transport system, involved in lipoprotein release, permease component